MNATDIGRARKLAANWYYQELWGWDYEKMSMDMERNAFHKAMLICANGDGILAPEERQWVIGKAAASGVTEAELDAIEAYSADDDINEVVDSTLATSKSRGAVVYFAIRAASSDGDYNDDEKNTVRRMAKNMGMNESDVINIENLVKEEQRLKKERFRLCFPDGDPFGS